MGNCVCASKVLGHELGEKFIRIVREDGKILELKSPMLVKDLLLDGSCEGRAVFYARAVCQALSLDHQLVPGQLYYLLPWQGEAKRPNSCVSSEDNGKDEYTAEVPSIPPTTPLLNCAETKVHVPSGDSLPKVASTAPNVGVRLKVIITKEQLRALLAKDSINKVQSLEDLVVRLQTDAKTIVVERKDSSRGRSNPGWRPALESIAEAGDEVPFQQYPSS